MAPATAAGFGVSAALYSTPNPQPAYILPVVVFCSASARHPVGQRFAPQFQPLGP